MPRRTWIDQTVDTYVDELAKFGLNAPRDVVVKQMRTQLASVAARLGVTEQTARSYFSPDSIREQARQVAAGLADEQPGADLWNAPRNIPVPVAIVGRTITALAEAGGLRLSIDDRAGTEGALKLISLMANFVSRRPASDDAEVVCLPQALLNRAARFLDASAELSRSDGEATFDDHGRVVSPEQLAEAFEDDAKNLRLFVGLHGFSAGQITPG